MDRSNLHEAVTVRRSSALPGVEVMDVQHSARSWRVFNVAYSFALPETWHGTVAYRSRSYESGPRSLFLTEPGEVHVTRPGKTRPGKAGAFKVFVIDAPVLTAYAAEHGSGGREVCWRAPAPSCSKTLLERASRVVELVGRESSALEAQSAMVELVATLWNEVIEHGRSKSPASDPEARAAERIRECLHYNEAGIDLEALAKKAGVSPFRALRAFKRRYGLPPHAYQICVRIGMARGLLAQGRPAADVAAECGFVDQSHLTRHFKRLVGVTPARFSSKAQGRHLFASS